MPEIHVCSLARLPQVAASCGASHVLTLVSEGTRVSTPPGIADGAHLYLTPSDLPAFGASASAAESELMERLLAFARAWDGERPLVVHCWAGISRSTAAAFVIACALEPSRPEISVARELRFLSPTASPNRRLVALGDAALGRGGRMVSAIEAIGRGAFASEGRPFVMAIGGPA